MPQNCARPCFRQLLALSWGHEVLLPTGPSIRMRWFRRSECTPFPSVRSTALFLSLPSGPAAFLACAFLPRLSPESCALSSLRKFASARFFLHWSIFFALSSDHRVRLDVFRMENWKSFGVRHCYPLSYRSRQPDLYCRPTGLKAAARHGTS